MAEVTKEKRITNKEFASKDTHFIAKCDALKKNPTDAAINTKRQASKYRRGYGRVFKSEYPNK